MEEPKKPAKYLRLVQDIKEKISTGVYISGDKIESENQMVKEYGYSRQTIRQALGILENQGFVIRQRGSGTYVAPAVKQKEKTFNIGVIATYVSDYIFPFIIGGIEEELTPMGYNITLGITRNKIEEESRVLKSFMERNMDGVIIEGTKSAFPNPNLDLYRKLREKGIPAVFFNSYYPELENSVYVVTEDQKAGYDIACHMISCGCESIGGIFKSDDMQGHKRYSGYVQALMNSGMDFDDDNVMWYTTSDEERFGEEEFDRYIYRHYSKCDGIVCYNDKIASLITGVMLRYGARIPEDKMIGSFDNSRISDLSAVRITSMNHPKEELGRLVARKLIETIDTGRPQPSVKMPMELIVKDSTR